VGPDISLKDKQRILCIDALRGFDMLWIIGGGEMIAFCKSNRFCLSTIPTIDHFGANFHFYDIIMPLFLFIVELLCLSRSGNDGQWGKQNYLHVVKE
jgi:hypothetical protein